MMNVKRALCLLLILLLPLLAAAEQLTPPGLPDCELALWVRDGQGYLYRLEENDLSRVALSHYVTPRLALTNGTDQPIKGEVLWQLDGEEIPFGSLCLQPGEAVSLCLSRDSAERLTPGEHSLRAILAGSLLGDWSFTLTDSGALRPDPPLNFAWGDLTPASLRVSGLNWRTRKRTGSNTAPGTFAVMTAAEVTRLVQAGGSVSIHYKLTCQQSLTPVTLQGELLLAAPNGFTYRVEGPVILCRESRRWDELGQGFFPALLAACGEIPAGDYRLVLSLEGMAANVSILTLK